MTISTTSNTVTAQGNGVNTSWPYTFLIPSADDVVITKTLISDGSTTVLDTSQYSITGLDDPNGGTVTYPLVGSPLASTYNLTIQRILPLTQEVDLVNQSGFYPDVVEGGFDTLCMQIQQLQEEVSQALAFPVGATSSNAQTILTAILNGAANAAAAAASAASAASSLATLLAQLPVNAANIQTDAVTSAKIIANAVTPIKLATASIPYGATMLNGEFTVTVSANACTIALKTLAGTDPSATDPVYVLFRSSTVGSGVYLVRTITAALSLTISAGSTLGFSSAISGRFWIVLFDDAGTVRIGAINCRIGAGNAGINIYQLTGWGIASSTAEGGAGAADSAGVFYTGTAVSSKAYVVAGYATWETALTTAGTWDTNPTRIHLHNMTEALPGMVVQVQRTITGSSTTGSTTIPLDDTIPQITEGNEYMTQAITPSSAANILEIEAQVVAANDTVATMQAALFQDATANAFAAVYDQAASANSDAVLHIFYAIPSKTTSATTWRIRAGAGAAGTTTFNGFGGNRKYADTMNSYLQIREIMA